MHMTVNIDRYIEDMEQWKKTREENERLQQELQRKDNIINELKEELEFELQFQKGGCYNRIKNLLDKIKELENGNK